MPTILIVDDEEVMRTMLTASFAKKGFRVLEAPDGRVAERMIFTEPIDCVISDINMPEMGGLELVQRVKFVNPSIKIILMTGYHNFDHVPFCMKHNVSRYLNKPFRLDQINSMVAEVLAEKVPDTITQAEHNMDGWLELELKSTEDSLLRMHEYIQQYLRKYMPHKSISKIAHCFYEMVHNAIEWGNRMDAGKTVHVGCLVLSDRVLFKIQDEGNGFNVDRARDPVADPFARQTDRELQGKRPGGYGIEITSKLMDEIYYSEEGNCMIMTKFIAPENQEAEAGR